MAVTEPRLTPDPGNERPDLDRQKSLWARMWEHRALYVAISPFYILFAVFGLFPIGFSLYLAFHKWDGIGVMTFNGLNNFKYMLTDAEFWQAVGNTFMIWIYSTIPMLFFALIIAFCCMHHL